jgi:hypothetical protein
VHLIERSLCEVEVPCAIDVVVERLRKSCLRRATVATMLRWMVACMVVPGGMLLVWLWLAAMAAVIMSRHAPQTTTFA